ncbi:DUF29 domain-containing protein [Candidatus Synechococcus calcipolaris G9]|uniref:DUF29 domain-containing protein n=2 Tax=Synechococcus TaxID=1129 RepID=A0ABT6F2J5_9SYNE|nr:DUF29 domain-containing protein [Candidatus Synechococcus calcipolaris]MDG2992081.1 DUF29 domain-containing protein [Candidatus Synechococcus calcipolaris G9]
MAKGSPQSGQDYETDFYGWTQNQARLLRRGQFTELDIINLSEEIEALGRQQRQELKSRLGILIGHLLKWQYQSEKRSRSWQVTIRGQRRDIQELLLDNPSLKPYIPEALSRGFLVGLDLVVLETPLTYVAFPDECPYTLEQLFDYNFPEGIADLL